MSSSDQSRLLQDQPQSSDESSERATGEKKPLLSPRVRWWLTVVVAVASMISTTVTISQMGALSSALQASSGLDSEGHHPMNDPVQCARSYGSGCRDCLWARCPGVESLDQGLWWCGADSTCYHPIEWDTAQCPQAARTRGWTNDKSCPKCDAQKSCGACFANHNCHGWCVDPPVCLSLTNSFDDFFFKHCYKTGGSFTDPSLQIGRPSQCPGYNSSWSVTDDKDGWDCTKVRGFSSIVSSYGTALGLAIFSLVVSVLRLGCKLRCEKWGLEKPGLVYRCAQGLLDLVLPFSTLFVIIAEYAAIDNRFSGLTADVLLENCSQPSRGAIEKASVYFRNATISGSLSLVLAGVGCCLLGKEAAGIAAKKAGAAVQAAKTALTNMTSPTAAAAKGPAQQPAQFQGQQNPQVGYQPPVYQPQGGLPPWQHQQPQQAGMMPPWQQQQPQWQPQPQLQPGQHVPWQPGQPMWQPQPGPWQPQQQPQPYMQTQQGASTLANPAPPRPKGQ